MRSVGWVAIQRLHVCNRVKVFHPHLWGLVVELVFCGCMDVTGLKYSTLNCEVLCLMLDLVFWGCMDGTGLKYCYSIPSSPVRSGGWVGILWLHVCNRVKLIHPHLWGLLVELVFCGCMYVTGLNLSFLTCEVWWLSWYSAAACSGIIWLALAGKPEQAWGPPHSPEYMYSTLGFIMPVPHTRALQSFLLHV